MAPTANRRIIELLLCATLLVAALPSIAADTAPTLRGVGLHLDTGRDIYLGGLYLSGNDTEVADPAGLTAPWIMEYRIVARRTSIRSLLGGMLLQSEIATGQPPGQSTADFTDAILSVVKSSLYAGDALAIGLDKQRQSVALLNGHELARIDDAAVADYLLLGWIGEKGAATAFRNNLTGQEAAPDLLAAFKATRFSSERDIEVAVWTGAPAATPAPTVARAPAPTPAPASAPASAPAPAPASARTPPPTPPAAPTRAPAVDVFEEVAIEETQPQPAIAVITRVPEPIAPETPAPVTSNIEPGASEAPAPITSDIEPVAATTAETPPAEESVAQVASLAPGVEPTPETSTQEEVMSLELQEYSERLSRFHGSLVSSVYKHIRYPARAVRRNMQGRLDMDIALHDSGKLVDITVSRSSGHKILDNAAVEAAQLALGSGGMGAIDPVAIAEFGTGNGNVVVPVPVNFTLAD